MKLSSIFVLLVSSNTEKVSTHESTKKEQKFKNEVFFSADGVSDLNCEQFDTMITGGSYECDAFDEFGKCKLNCSTGTLVK